MKVFTALVDTPFGKMIAGSSEKGLCLFDFPYRNMMPVIKRRLELTIDAEFESVASSFFEKLEKDILNYFEGNLQVFNQKLHLVGTPFQIKVWENLLKIPYGETRSYQQQANAIGDSHLVRAVARANGENALAILVPCHRVIGNNGALIGYSGGLDKKRKLLDLERKGIGKELQLDLF